MVRLWLAAFAAIALIVLIHTPVSSAQPQDQTILVEDVVFQGNRRFPRESLLYYIQTRKGDPYNPAQLERDLQALWAQGFFSMIRVLARDGEQGGKIVIFDVKENPIIRDLKFSGLKSMQESDVLQKFREKKAGISKEEAWDPAKGQNATRVLKELLAEKGHPDATVKIDTEVLSTAAIAITFMVNEGPRVRVIKIEFEGNQVFSNKKLRSAMKNVKQAGLFTKFTSKDVYNPQALDQDLQRVRLFILAGNGYIDAQFGKPRVEGMERGGGIPIPLLRKPKRGLRIIIPVDEGKQHRFGKIAVEGNTVFTSDQILGIIGMKSGDIVKSTVIQKGVYETLRDLYGSRGYIEFVAYPSDTEPTRRDDPDHPGGRIADFTISIEEGRQFTLTRLEFTGNTITRDKVMRREMFVSEGDIFNQLAWKSSLLRLNQLGLFEEVKEEDATLRPNDRTGDLEIDLKVKEKGRNQIQFTGGASGVGGSFFGLDYSTNNLLGYGESLALSFAAGNRQKYVSFSFTEPYVFDRNISAGFTVFSRSLDFFGGGLGFGSSGFIDTGGGFLGFGISGESLFSERSSGINLFASTPFRTITKKFPRLGQYARVGLSYSINTTSIKDPPVNRDTNPDNDIPVTFRQPGIITSTIVPSFFYSSLNHPLDPTIGQSFSVTLGFSGGVLGGDVKLLQPGVEYKWFHPAPWKFKTFFGKPATIGFRALASHISTYGPIFNSNSLSFVGGTPIFSRFFLGGEDTIRGYNIRSISPVVPTEQRLTTTQVEAVLASETDPIKAAALPVKKSGDLATGDPFVRKDIIDSFTFTNALTSQSFIPVGGDTQGLFNFEYRIPLAGPLTVAYFLDIGTAFNIRSYRDQRISSNPLKRVLNPFGLPLTVNANGDVATAEEEQAARLAQGTPAGEVPLGFNSVLVRGLAQTTDNVFLSQGNRGLRGIQNYRASTGIEFRFQLPVINVPFRLIWAYNPNAKTQPTPTQIFREDRTVFRFSIGRTF